MLKTKPSLFRCFVIGLVLVLSVSTVAFGATGNNLPEAEDYSQYVGVVKGVAPNPNDTPADVGGTIVEITDESTIPISDISHVTMKKTIISDSSAKGDDPVIARQTVHIYMYQDLVSWSGNWIYVNYAFSNTQSKNISNVYWSTRAAKPDGTLIDGNIYSMDITPSTPSPAVSKTFAVYTGSVTKVNLHNWAHNVYFQNYTGNYSLDYNNYILSFSR